MSEVQSALQSQLAELQRLGAHRYDPIRFRYLESLTERLSGIPHGAHHDKLQQALDHFQERFLTEKKATQAIAEQLVQQHRINREDVQRHLDNGDVRAIHALAARHQRPPSPLSSLLDAFQTKDETNDDQTNDTDTLSELLREQHGRLQRLGNDRPATPLRELKATRHLRTTQARLHTEHRIHQAITAAPDEAGPLNSHRLVTQALERMGAISPAYLNRFAGYMEVLMVLEKNAKKT